MLKLVPLILCLAAPLGAFRDGNYLLDSCRDVVLFMDDQQGSDQGSTGDARSGWCLGFVEGVSEMDAMTTKLLELSRVEFTSAACVPEGAKLGQLIRVVVRFLKEHPEELHKPASLGVSKALRDAFPCPTGQK